MVRFDPLRFVLPAAGLILLAAGCAGTGAGHPVEVTRAAWTSPVGGEGQQLLTDHYDVRTTVRDEMLLTYLPPFLETAYQAYASLMPAEAPSDERMVTYLFGGRREWAAYTSQTFPRRAHMYLHIHAGGFMDHASATTVIHDLGRDRTLSLLGHEGFHQYVAANFPEHLPPWLNEGMATQWEAFELDGDRPVWTPERNFLRRNSLREALTVEGGLIPLVELLRMHAGDAVVETGQTVRGYYAQVWSLVLFMREGADGRYADAFRELLNDAGTERMRLAISGYRAATPEAGTMSIGEITFRHYITEELDAFNSEYIAYARYLVR